MNKKIILATIIISMLILTGCSFTINENVLYVFLKGKTVDNELFFRSTPDGLRFTREIPNINMYSDEKVALNLNSYYYGKNLSFKMTNSRGYDYEIKNDLLIIHGKRKGSWNAQINIFSNGKMYFGNKFKVNVLEKKNEKDEQEDTKQQNIITENNETIRLISISSSSSSGFSQTINEEEKCIFPRTIQNEEKEFMEEIKKYDNISKILDFINNNFTLIESQNFTMRKPVEIYNSRQGTEYELLRLFFFISLRNCYSPMYLLYEYNESEQTKYGPIIVYRGLGYEEEINDPRYFYLDEGEFKTIHYGWDYLGLILLEDERKNIYIENLGFLIEQNIWLNAEENTTNIFEWVPRSYYEN